MGKLDPDPDRDRDRDRPSPQLLRVLQEQLQPIAPLPEVRDSLLTRILKRTVRAGRDGCKRQTGPAPPARPHPKPTPQDQQGD